MLLRHRLVLCLVILAVAAACFVPARAAAQTTALSSARVNDLLNQSGYTVVRKTDTVWYVEFTGKELKKFKVIFAVQDDLLVTFVNPATKAQMDVTPEFMRKVMKLNHSLDRVKVGLDADDDLFVRVDSTVRIMDLTELKAVVSQVSAAADESFIALRPYITAP
jgi:hypothetical protein